MIVHIQCTVKLLQKLDPHAPEIPAPSGILSRWHANLLRINRKECVIFTHDKTLYSLVIPKTTKQFYKNVGNIFLDSLVANLRYENLEKYRDLVSPKSSEVFFVKSTDRRVLGTINNMTRFIERFVYQSGGFEHTNLYELARYINEIPFTPINYRYPIECFREHLSEYFDVH